MGKTFQPKLYRILLNGLYGIFAGVFAAVLIGYLSDSVLYAMIAGIGVLVLYIWLVIIKNFLTIKIDSTHLTVKKGSEEKHFEIAQCGFRAKTITSSWDTECKLYITDPEGKEHLVDCELIGIGQFEELLEELGMGSNQTSATPLPTQKK